MVKFYFKFVLAKAHAIKFGNNFVPVVYLKLLLKNLFESFKHHS